MRELQSRRSCLTPSSAACRESFFQCIVLFYLDSCSVCVLAAVLLPRAMAMVLGSDTTDTQAFVSHFPRALQGSQELYICQGTKQAVTGLREKALEQRWALRGQDVIVCFNRFWRNARHCRMQLWKPNSCFWFRNACRSILEYVHILWHSAQPHMQQSMQIRL